MGNSNGTDDPVPETPVPIRKFNSLKQHNHHDCNRFVIGVLLDVSGSMQNPFEKAHTLEVSDQPEELLKSHAILETLVSIIDQDYTREDLIFCSAFGTQMRKPKQLEGEWEEIPWQEEWPKEKVELKEEEWIANLGSHVFGKDGVCCDLLALLEHLHAHAAMTNNSEVVKLRNRNEELKCILVELDEKIHEHESIINEARKTLELVNRAPSVLQTNEEIHPIACDVIETQTYQFKKEINPIAFDFIDTQTDQTDPLNTSDPIQSLMKQIGIKQTRLDDLKARKHKIQVLFEKSSPKPQTGKQDLTDLARYHKIVSCTNWIQNFNDLDAAILFCRLSENKYLVPILAPMIPDYSLFNRTVRIMNPNNAADKLVRSIIEGEISKEYYELCISKEFETTPQYLQPRPIKSVSKLFERLLQRPTPNAKDKSRVLDIIKPYIYGGTPMCQALIEAEKVFSPSEASKVLFILSDGEAADGDPVPFAKGLVESGVRILTCYLTTKSKYTRRLFYEADPEWSYGMQTLFKMSSVLPNTTSPLPLLTTRGWKLPRAGHSRLFFIADSVEDVKEFCELVTSQMTTCVDALVDILAEIHLDEFINNKNSSLKPATQTGDSCYAHAIAAVYHLAMLRIHGRDGKYQSFDRIKVDLEAKYGTSGAETKKVIESTCKDYRLHFKQINEAEARDVINQRRPVVARFELDENQWKDFKEFYQKRPNGTIKKENLRSLKGKPLGHAVVLIRCDPFRLRFMSSWGQEWGDGGFFYVADENVLDKMVFFDIFWNEDDLIPSEKDEFQRKGLEQVKDLATNFSSIGALRYSCPMCKEESLVAEYLGHVLESICPKCKCSFKPDYIGVRECLYLNSKLVKTKGEGNVIPNKY